MPKAVIISGYLHNLSDNIIPFLSLDTDVFVHTWSDRDNLRWIGKLNRYKKYCNDLTVVVEEPKYSKKLWSYFYSTWKAYSLLKDPSKYQLIVKFKPNLDTDKIPAAFNIVDYFRKAALQSRPLLSGYSYDDCLYGLVYYKTLDERIFSGCPKAFNKFFSMSFDRMRQNVLDLDRYLEKKHGQNYEGSIFWTEWASERDIPIIQDLDLFLTNNITK